MLNSLPTFARLEAELSKLPGVGSKTAARLAFHLLRTSEQDVEALAEALFKKSISITVTWRIIMGAIIFVALFTTIHFIIWSKRSGKMGEELAAPAGEGIKTVPKPGQGGEEESPETA